MSGSVKAIDKASVHRITSGQVIVDLCSAVKELVENALDAGATSVEVRLKEHGSELIEVADNGHGIEPVDYESIALKYHTSKISSFEDVSRVQSFGFRGEALSSLCAVSTVVFTTRTRAQDVGMKLSFDSRGHLQSKEVAPRSPGTTASIKDLFKSLPVRAKAFKNNLKKEYVKLVHLLQAYATVCTGIRFIATNQIKKAARTTIVSTQSKPAVKDNVAAIFGAKLASSLEPIDASNDKFAISGVISSAVKVGGKTNGHPQFLFLNSRPVDMPKAVRVVNEAYRSLSSPALSGYKAVFAINITVDSSMIDVNVTPDKRTVFVQQEAVLLDLLRSSLEDLWDPAKWQGAQSLANIQGKLESGHNTSNCDISKFQLKWKAPVHAITPMANESTKQQSVLNPFRTKKGGADGGDPSQRTPQGCPKQERETQDSAQPATVPRGADAAAATPSSAAAPITPAPNGELDADITPCTAAADSVDPQHLASGQQETPKGQHQVAATDAECKIDNDAHHQGTEAMNSETGAALAATANKDAAASKQSRAKGALAAAMSRTGPKKSTAAKLDSEFVRAATAATTAAAASSAARGAADSSSPTPASVSGSRLKLRSPGKPPILLAGSTTPSAAPDSSNLADAGPQIVPGESAEHPSEKQVAVLSGEGQTSAASPPDAARVDATPAPDSEEHRTRMAGASVDAVEIVHAQENVPPHVEDEHGTCPSEVDAGTALHRTSDGGYQCEVRNSVSLLDDKVMELSPRSQQRAKTDDLTATAPRLRTPASRGTAHVGDSGGGCGRNGSDHAADQECVQPKGPAAALHGRVSVEHVDLTDGLNNDDQDVHMLEDVTEDGEDDAGSTQRPKRRAQCLSDSPEASPIKKQSKAARTCTVPDQPSHDAANPDGTSANTAAAALLMEKPTGQVAVACDVEDSGKGSRGADGLVASVGTEDAAETPNMQNAQKTAEVPSEPKQDDIPEWELAQEIAASNHIAALDGTAILNSADDTQEVLEVAGAEGAADPSQHLPEGERWRVEGGRVRARVDVAGMRDRRLAAVERRLGTVTQKLKDSALSCFKAASLQALRADGDGGSEQEAQAANELERRFNKNDFRHMVIHGQFNKGFIMASCGRELFIIDQHASDEKYNFERLQDTLVLNKQPLIVPIDLGLASVDDMTIRENMEVFETNGFGFVDDLESGMLRLSSVPFSKGTTFGPDDVHEMISMIHNGESTRIYVGDKRKSAVATKCRIRPSRVRSMLAMRACRGSIMVGTSLSRQQMQTTIERLADLDGPWNCPHGRPTLRHVHTLSVDA